MIPNSNEIRIETTTQCNYNCIICPREKLSRKKETMSIRDFQLLLEMIYVERPEYNVLTFAGIGEPLLDAGLEDKIKLARSMGFDILLLTNGSLLSINKWKAFEELGVTSVRVSMYGSDKETYEKVHGVNDKYYDVVSALNDICSIKKNTKLLMTYNDIGQVLVQDWIDMWECKVDAIEIWKPHNWVNLKSYRCVQEKEISTCGRPFSGPLQIQVDGTVIMCCFDYNGKLELGNLHKQSLEEIFSSEPYKDLAFRHALGAFKNSGLICEKCDQRNYDKSDVMIYSSTTDDLNKRVKQVSTTYKEIV